MNHNVTVTKSVEVDLVLLSGPHGPVLVAEAFNGDLEVTRVHCHGRDDGYTITGCFDDNYAVQSKVREGQDDVTFDSEHGQFFAYAPNYEVAERLARAVALAATEVALERGRL
jgi:hypothetical protein